MSYASIMRSSRRELERELGSEYSNGTQVFTWGGSDYPCQEGTLDVQSLQERGGHIEDIDLVLVVRMKSEPTDFIQWDWTDGSGPKSEQQVIVDGRTMLIDKASPFNRVQLKLYCRDPDRI